MLLSLTGQRSILGSGPYPASTRPSYLPEVQIWELHVLSGIFLADSGLKAKTSMPILEHLDTWQTVQPSPTHGNNLPVSCSAWILSEVLRRSVGIPTWRGRPPLALTVFFGPYKASSDCNLPVSLPSASHLQSFI
jgi:hypothetical protein